MSSMHRPTSLRLLLLLYVLSMLGCAFGNQGEAAARAAISSIGVKHPIEYLAPPSAAGPSLLSLYARGACLRLLSDCFGGIPLENVKIATSLRRERVKAKANKSRGVWDVTASPAYASYSSLARRPVPLGPDSRLPEHLRCHNPLQLYGLTSTPRLVESGLQGGIFLLSSRVVRSQLLVAGAGFKAAALLGGVAGGFCQR